MAKQRMARDLPGPCLPEDQRLGSRSPVPRGGHKRRHSRVGATSKDIPVSRRDTHSSRPTARAPNGPIHFSMFEGELPARMGTMEYGGKIRTERRMEPADEGEGIYRFASVGKF